MTHTELQQIQEAISFDGQSMALSLGIDYEQYRRYRYGHAAIPESVQRRIREIEQINVTFMQGLPGRVDANCKNSFW